MDFKNIYFFDTLESTNLYAQEHIKSKKITSNSVIVAKKQIAGKGQRGAQWFSNYNENLLVSLVLFHRSFPVDDAFYLSKITSLALYDFIQELTEGQVRIKWPNDIFIGEKKVAGILIENNLTGNRIISSVIGIGLNVNQLEFEEELNATSIYKESGKKYTLTELPSSFLPYFKKWFSTSKEKLKPEYLKRLYAFGETKSYEDKNGIFKAKILGVAENGLLQLKKEDGGISSYEIKDVRLIK